MSSEIQYFGIRHHGPGSAKCLIKALESFEPRAVLIEGPSDATELIPLLGDKEMVPPIALLAYDPKNPANTSFWPFAEYSPEYQAIQYALLNNVKVQFIDLPSAVSLSQEKEKSDENQKSFHPSKDIYKDPIGALARLSDYEDGESWWSHLIEENPESGPIFEHVAIAMSELRKVEIDLPINESLREAHMRLEISKASKEVDGPIAVVCGAWHVPALTTPTKLKDDRALLKGLSKIKPAMTWAPWTEPRLSKASGYGAGVQFPGWYKHLWQYGHDSSLVTRWLVKMAGILRDMGHQVSTAEVIEAERLALTLASIRKRPRPNYEELKDAAIACMFHGENIIYKSISDELLIGSGVGQISNKTPLAPLLEDLKTQQKKAKLKPEALDKELSIDLRSESGLLKSTLLHRLKVLDIAWGSLRQSGRSRGTFRENWVLRWEPEYAVTLVEKLVYGPTIEQAANQFIISKMKDKVTLSELAELLHESMTAQLTSAISEGLKRIEESATKTNDCNELLKTLEPMANVLRYGEARAGSKEYLGEIIRSIALKGFIAMPYAVRDLDEEASLEMSASIEAANQALRIIESKQEDLDSWYLTLRQVADQPSSTASIAGLATRILYEVEQLKAEEAAHYLNRHLSPGTMTKDAAGFFEGFLSGVTERLIYDPPLLKAVNNWLMELDEEDLIQNLPLFRRVFSSLDKLSRQRLVDTIIRPAEALSSIFKPLEESNIWENHRPTILQILKEGEKRCESIT